MSPRDYRNLSVDEDKANGECSCRHLLQSVHVVRGSSGPGAGTLPSGPTDPGGSGRRAAASVE